MYKKHLTNSNIHSELKTLRKLGQLDKKKKKKKPIANITLNDKKLKSFH